MSEDVNEFVRQFSAGQSAATPKPKPKSIPFDPERLGFLLGQSTKKQIEKSLAEHSKLIVQEMMAFIKPRIVALEADNKSLTDLVGELEAEIARLKQERAA